MLLLPQDEVLQGQDDLQNQVSGVHDSISSVQDRLKDMEQSFLLNQDYANQGIHLLCKCVACPHCCDKPGQRDVKTAAGLLMVKCRGVA